MIYPVAKKEAYANETYTLKQKWNTADGLIPFCKSTETAIEDIRFTLDAFLATEEYKIIIDENGVNIFHSTDEGKFRALTSLYQLVVKQGNSLKHANICDAPDFKRRGYMLDISRGRMVKKEYLKTIIDYLALLKYNELQLYMESFCFQYEKFPSYTADFECLDASDIEELDSYCKARFIELVPNQNTFGHMGAWLAKDELRFLSVEADGQKTGTLNALLPETEELIEKIFDSLLPHFSSSYVHIGFDEVAGLDKFQHEEYCQKHGRETLYMEYLNKVCRLAQKHGKKAMIWGDAFFDLPSEYKKHYELMPKDVTVMEWGYDLIQSQIMAEHCFNLQSRGLRYYVCPATSMHLSFTGRSEVSVFNIRTAGEVGKKYGAEGYLLTDWGDSGHPQFWAWSAPLVALGGQCSWNCGRVQNGFHKGRVQDGADFKLPFLHGSWDFADEYFFGGSKLSKTMWFLGNYYLLETERIHNGTLIVRELFEELDPLKRPLSHHEDVFTNESIGKYVRHYMEKIKASNAEDILKRQLLINCEMVLLCVEIAEMRLKNRFDKEEGKRLINAIQAVKEEYISLWKIFNYEKGVEIFTSALDQKVNELLDLCSLL